MLWPASGSDVRVCAVFDFAERLEFAHDFRGFDLRATDGIHGVGAFDGIWFAWPGVWDSAQTSGRHNAADWDMGTGTRCAAARVAAAVGHWMQQLLEQPYEFTGCADHDGGRHFGRHFSLHAGELDDSVARFSSRLFLGR